MKTFKEQVLENNDTMLMVFEAICKRCHDDIKENNKYAKDAEKYLAKMERLFVECKNR